MKKFKMSLLIIILFPLILLLIYSFSYNWSYPNIFPTNFTIRGLKEVFTTDLFSVIFQSISISLFSTLLTLLLCIPASRALSNNEYKLKGRTIFIILFTSPLILPLASITMGIHLLFIKVNLINTVLGVVLINVLPCIPYAIRLITNVMTIVGTNQEKIAKNLGASPLSAFFKVTLPNLIPGIMSTFSFVFIISFSQYFTTLLIGGGKITTLPVIMIPFIQNGNRTLSSLYSLIFILSAFLVLLIFEKLLNKYYKKRGFVIQFNI